MLTETIHAIAPGADMLYLGSTTSLDLMSGTLAAVDGKLGDVVVNGWYTLSEAVPDAETQLFSQIAQQAASTGITLLCAAGDLGDGTRSGNSKPDVAFPASNPLVTSVGGTSLLLGRNGSLRREVGFAKSAWVVEDGAWTEAPETTFRAGGGGVSEKFAQPDYQRGVVSAPVGTRETGGTGRAIPDIAMLADAETGMLIGYTQHYPDGSNRYGERRLATDTSATALMAGLVALANARVKHNHGFLNPALYATWKAHRSAFRDIVRSGHEGSRVRIDYVDGSTPAKGTAPTLKLFEDFTSNQPGRGFDTATGLGAPSPSLLSFF
jgi:subtilase family serine protease